MELKIVAFDITNLNKNLDLSKINKNYIIDNMYYQLDILDKLEKSEYKGPKDCHTYVITYEESDDYFHNKYFTEVYELDVDDDELTVREVEEYQWDIHNAELIKNRFYYFEICRSSRIEYYIVDTLNVKVNINFKKASQYEIYKITKLGTRIYI